MEEWINKTKDAASRLGLIAALIPFLLRYLVKNTITGRFLLFVVLPVVLIYYLFFQPLPDDLSQYEDVLVHIPSGASFKQVADSLEKSRLLEHKRLFLLLGKISGKETDIRAGLIKVPQGLTTWQLIKYLENASPALIKVTLPEGILSFEMAGILQESIGIDSAKFVSLVYDSAFTKSLIGESTTLEGYLFPETYFFEWKMAETRIIKRMVSNTLIIFKPDSIQDRLSKLGKTRREIVILASIIEGEVVVDSERVIIASLYHNRLRLGWPLQADPTIQYAIPGPPRRLLKRDLEIDSPYNTYKYTGLPPGPINNPGKKSILAALYPADTSYLFMVAIGDGRHKFSKTLREHNYWHQKFNEVRRRVRREQR